MKRILSLLLVAFLVLGLMSGCVNGNKVDNGKNDNVSNSVVISKADVVFKDKSGDATYRIVRPEEGEFDEVTFATILFKQFKSKIGISVKNSADNVEGTDTYEILLGNTNRPESKQALDYLSSKVTVAITTGLFALSVKR